MSLQVRVVHNYFG